MISPGTELGFGAALQKAKDELSTELLLAAPETHAPSSRLWREALLRAVHRVAEGQKASQLERLAEKLVELGVGGNVTAIKLVGDRLDGSASDVSDADPAGTWRVSWEDG